MSEDYLFVYGTLRSEKGHPLNALLKSSSRFACKASFQGRLYEIDGYPGAVLSENPGDKICGEVYLLLNPYPLLKVLDRYEEVGPDFPEPNEYVRKKEKVILESGEKLEAWLYLYNRSTEGLPSIDSGDYCSQD